MMKIPAKDKEILRVLGTEIAGIASLPVNKTRTENKERIDNLERSKPPVFIYQEPWNELNYDGELDLHCEDEFCRRLEEGVRRTIYRWNHFPGDMVVPPVIYQTLCINRIDFGLSEDVDIRRTSVSSDVVSRHYNIQIKDIDDIEKIKMPVLMHDAEKTEDEFAAKCEIFDGIIPVEKRGVSGFWFNPWDDIVRLTGVTEVLLDMVERPEYVHMIIDRFTTGWLSWLDQHEEQGILTEPCSRLWGDGAAQIFGSVSPEMHEEFALRYEAKLFARFSRNKYGCCEPLENKVDIVMKNIPNLRKISMSPWVDFDKAVKNVGDRLVFMWKPNPAVLASETWDPEFVRKDMTEKLEKARGCAVEIHMKDISTVRWQPKRLWEWSQIAAEVTEQFA